MVSPTYMVEQCLEKRPEFDHGYVILSWIEWLNDTWKENMIFIEVKNIADWPWYTIFMSSIIHNIFIWYPYHDVEN